MAVEKPIIGLNPVNLPRVEYTRELAPVQEKGHEDLDIDDSPYWEEYWRRKKQGKKGSARFGENPNKYHEILPKEYRETFKFANMRVARGWTEHHIERIRKFDPHAIPKIKLLRKGKYVYATTAELRKMGFLDTPVRKKSIIRKEGESLKVGIQTGYINPYRQQDIWHAKRWYTGSGKGPVRKHTKRISYRQMHKQHDELLKAQRKFFRELKKGKKIPFKGSLMSTGRHEIQRKLENVLMRNIIY